MRRCKVKGLDKETKEILWIEAEFFGVFQKSFVKQAILIGETGGVVAMPVAVVELEGNLLELALSSVELEEVAE